MNMQIRDARTEKRFFIDNVIIQEYGSDIGVYGIAVYSALCMHARLKTQSCYPSHKTIAAEIGAGISKVKQTLKHLAELRLIHIAADFRENKGQTSNVYTILNPPSRQMATPQSPDNSPPGHQVATNNPNPEQSESNPLPPVGGGEAVSGEWIKPRNGQVDYHPHVSEKEAKTRVADALAQVGTGDAGIADPRLEGQTVAARLVREFIDVNRWDYADFTADALAQWEREVKKKVLRGIGRVHEAKLSQALAELYDGTAKDKKGRPLIQVYGGYWTTPFSDSFQSQLLARYRTLCSNGHGGRGASAASVNPLVLQRLGYAG